VSDLQELRRHLKLARARWDDLLVERMRYEHGTEKPVPVDLARELWGEFVQILAASAAIAKLTGAEAGQVPVPVLQWGASRLNAALEGRPDPGLCWRRGGKTPSLDERLGREMALEYAQLADEGFLDDPDAVRTVRAIFATRHTGPEGDWLLDESTFRRWTEQYEPRGRLRREILRAEAKEARDLAGQGDRAALGRAILERWAVKARARH
jgi:hypothetical protein